LSVSCKFHVGFVFLCCCTLIGRLFSQALVLLEDQHKKWVTESAWAARSAELEVLVKSQAEKIAQLETTCGDLKREKENITAGYWRLSEKCKTFTEKAEREKQILPKPMQQR
jgi:hypothetical protein